MMTDIFNGMKTRKIPPQKKDSGITSIDSYDVSYHTTVVKRGQKGDI